MRKLLSSLVFIAVGNIRSKCFLILLVTASVLLPANKLKASGSIVAWGYNYYRQCNIPSPNTGFIAIAAEGHHSLGLKTDGSIAAWGDNRHGQCNIPLPNTGFIAIAAGYEHSLGLKADGSIVAWGRNNYGQCNLPSPNTGFVAIAAGDDHSLGLKTDGSIVAWGDNDYGQCNIPSPNSGFIAIATGSMYSLGLKRDGSIVAWGYNYYGQCNTPSPNTGFIAIAAGESHSLGLKTDGSIVVWGDNSFGQCNIPSPNTGFIAIAAGYWYSLGLKADGSIVAWGDNRHGQCNIPSPNTGFIAIAAGVYHSLGLKADVGGGLSGVVRSQSTGNPIADANVTVPGKPIIQTNSSGQFSFSNLYSGQTTVMVDKSGYYPVTQMVTINSGSTTYINISMTQQASGTNPVVVDVSSQYCNLNKHVYYLNGVSLSQNFAVTVDWKGHTPGMVRWTTPTNTYDTSCPGTTVSKTFNVGSEFGTGGKLSIVAIAGDSSQSANKTANFDVIPPPPGIPVVMLIPNIVGNALSYNSIFTLGFIKEGVGEGIVPSEIPCFGGKAFEFVTAVELEAVVDGDGSASATVTIGDPCSMEIGGIEITPSVAVSLDWQYSSQQQQWIPGGSIGVDISGEYATPPHYFIIPVGPIPVPAYWRVALEAAIGVHLSLTGWNPDGSPILLGQVPFEVGAEVMLGVGVADVLAAEGYLGGGANMQLEFPNEEPLQQLSIELNGGIRITVFIFSYENNLLHYEWQLVGGESLGAVPMLQTLSTVKTADFKLMGRNYLKSDYAVWTPQLSRRQQSLYMKEIKTTGYEQSGQLAALGNLPIQQPINLSADVYPEGGDGIVNFLDWSVFASAWQTTPTSPQWDQNCDIAPVGGDNIIDYKDLAIFAEQWLVSVSEEQLLQYNVFDYSQPAIASEGNDLLLAWIYDDPNRISINRTELIFSKCVNGIWSQPGVIDDDNTADFSPQVVTLGDGNAICVWENVNQILSDDANLSQMAAAMDIKAGYYDSNTGVWTTHTLTNNNHLDHSPRIAAADNGTAMAVWIYNEKDDILGSDANALNEIRYRKRKGAKWSKPNTVASGIGLVVKTALAYDGNRAAYVYAVDPNWSWNTEADREIYAITYDGNTWSAPDRITDDNLIDTNPQIVYDENDILLVWYRDGNLVSCYNFDMNNVQEILSTTGSSGVMDFRLAKSPSGQISLVWNDTSSAGADIFTATYDPAKKIWSDSYQLTFDRDMERSIAAAYAGSEELALAYNKVRIVDVNGVPGPNRVDLCVLRHIIKGDLSILPSDISSSVPNPQPGTVVDISAVVHNRGDIAEVNVPVAFYNGDPDANGVQIGTQIIAGPIPAGGSVVASVYWLVPEVNEPQQIYVVVDPNFTKEDSVRSNNTAFISLMAPDLTVAEIRSERIGPKMRSVTACIKNAGSIASQNVNVVIHRDSINGPVLGSFDIPVLNALSSTDVSFEWNIAGENFSTPEVPVYVVVDEPNTITEFSEQNNTAFGSVWIGSNDIADITGDGKVYWDDLKVLAEQWLQPPDVPSADIAPTPADGIVNFLDYAVLAEHWLEGTSP